ncbi:MAG: YCF48-related protein [Candidatus Poribacteria bacterium]|nr:YCF48-related protein [Candidatus Poribacteria bacterium]
MKPKRIFSFIITSSIIGILLFPTVYGAGKWEIIRNDDFLRKDGVEGELQDVHCINQKQAWLVGRNGLILHTTDGGKKWIKKEIKTENPVDFLRVYFRGNKLGFITGTSLARRGGAILFITQDGGSTWESINPGVRSYLTGIWMIDNQVGFMVGANNAYLQTTDGGKTWKGKAERVAAGETRQNLWAISFSSPTKGWIVGSYGSIQHTVDGGQNWEDQDSGVSNNLKAIAFVNEKTGWIAGQEGMILHTNNGGITWTKQKTNSYNNLNDIIFVNEDTGWVAGDFGTILHTTNGGQTWNLQNTGNKTTLLAIGAAGEDHCLAVGEWGLVLGHTK